MARKFNADSRRKDRENAEITIGGEKLLPAAQSTELRSTLRLIGAQQTELAVRVEQLGDPTTAEERLESTQLDEQGERLMYQMAAVLLTDKDGGQVDADWLADELAPQDVGPLIEFLNGDDEAEKAKTPDPTSATKSR